MPAIPLTVVNAETARFECSFGRGCEGLCCKNGRPSVTPEERERIDANLKRVTPHMRPEAVRMVEREGWYGARTKLGLPMVRVSAGWCVFFNQGCVLHKVGMLEGDFSKYKPIQCALFPLEPNGDGTWYVRQWGYEGEKWDLFCLNPKNSDERVTDSMAGEIAVAAKLPADFDWTPAEPVRKPNGKPKGKKKAVPAPRPKRGKVGKSRRKA